MIGVFDSGIGGVTILKEIIKLLPHEKFLYYSDSFNNPYGDKDVVSLYQIVSRIVNFLINNGCKTIVIACNTASVLCVDRLRKDFKDITFIATVPAYKMVYDHNFNGKTLVMATKGTIESEKFHLLYDKYNNGKTIICPCVGLAELIEEGNKVKIKQYLSLMFKDYDKIDNIVLGCTHYPLIKDILKEIFGDVNFFDSGYGVAKQLERKVTKKMKGNLEITFIDSACSKEKEERFYKILNIS